MKQIMAVLILGTVLLSGCSAVGVIASSDPRVKMSQASEMMRQGRYFRARQLLDEALDIFQKRGDELGTAEVYRAYGFYYRGGGSKDTIVTAITVSGYRNEAAIEGIMKSQDYFKQAAAIFEKHEAFDLLSNIYFSMGQSYDALLEVSSACTAFEQSRAANRKAVDKNPGREVVLPSGYKTFDAFIDDAKTQARCPRA